MTAVWVLVLVAVVVLAYLGMWRGWQARVRRSRAALPELPTPPAAGERGAVLAAAEGTYVSTTTEGNWLDRVAAHRLGSRSLGSLTVHERGLHFSRGRDVPLWVAAAELRDVCDERAQAGKVLPGGGIVLVTWRHGDARLDTGFAPRRDADVQPLLHAVTDLLEEVS
ncbi:MAG: hypothetical protein ACRDO2_14945 [Nocardioidaceae bacterium]